MQQTVLTYVSLAMLTFGATAAIAADVEDSDGDGVFSMDELKAAYPDLTDDLFGVVDGNGDGMVDPDELAAALDAGLLVAG